MNSITKRKPVSKKERNVSVIIEEAALRNITVVIDGENGRYAINLGDYLGKAVAESIKNLEKIKKAEEENEKNADDPDRLDIDVETEEEGTENSSEEGASN